MRSKTRHAQLLYVAAYGDAVAADGDWQILKKLVAQEVLTVEAMALVNRDLDGTIHISDRTHEMGVSAAIGAVGGAVVGAIFPPALIATAFVGAALGGGSGAVVDRLTKGRIKADVEWILPPGRTGIVVIVDEALAPVVDNAVDRAERTWRQHVDDPDPDADRADGHHKATSAGPPRGQESASS